MKRIVLLLAALSAGLPTASAQSRFDDARLLEDVKMLSSDEFEGRSTGTRGGEKARRYIESGFTEVGLAPCRAEYGQPFTITRRSGEEVSGTNLLGLIPGTRHPDRSIVVSAHFDHVGVRGSEIYNGADDNASGTAALRAISQYFLAHPPQNSVVIAAFDGEEMGLRGARAFVDEPCVDLDSVLVNVNLDMISRNDRGEIFAAGTTPWPLLRPILEGIDETRDFTLLFGHDEPGTGRDDWTMASDQGPFHQVGIPFVYFGVEDHEGYHRPSDDFEFINRPFFIAVVDGVIEAVERLDARGEELLSARGR